MTSPGKVPVELIKAQKWANLLDTAFRLPVIRYRVGLDSIIGLIPGVGDAAMFLVGLRIILLAKKMGVPARVQRAMVRNSVIDFALGVTPVIGDIADLLFKSNVRNVRLMERWWLENNRQEVDGVTQEQLARWEREQLS